MNAIVKLGLERVYLTKRHFGKLILKYGDLLSWLIMNTFNLNFYHKKYVYY